MPDEFFQEDDEVLVSGPSVSLGIDQPIYMQEGILKLNNFNPLCYRG